VQKAVGPASIPPQKRHYFWVLFSWVGFIAQSKKNEKALSPQPRGLLSALMPTVGVQRPIQSSGFSQRQINSRVPHALQF
jgi:hypothetical protein